MNTILRETSPSSFFFPDRLCLLERGAVSSNKQFGLISLGLLNALSLTTTTTTGEIANACQCAAASERTEIIGR